MRLLKNTGTEQLIDELRPCFVPGAHVDICSPSLGEAIKLATADAGQVSGRGRRQLASRTHSETTTIQQLHNLDSFAGSGTTGQAVFEANAEDGGRRRFVLVQFPEPIQHAKFSTIAEITKERLRRVAKRLQDHRASQLGLGETTIDLGFRTFKLANSNIRAWDPRRDDIAGTLDKSVDHLKSDRTEDDILCELLLKFGLELTVPIDVKKIAGKTVYNIGAGTLMACLDTTIAAKDVEKLAHGIADWHKALAPAGETVVVFRDSAFADDVAKTNLTAILAQARENRPMIVRSL